MTGQMEPDYKLIAKLYEATRVKLANSLVVINELEVMLSLEKEKVSELESFITNITGRNSDEKSEL